MNFAVIGRPLGCLKAALRQTRQQRAWQRPLATAAAPRTPNGTKPVLTSRQRDREERLSRFEIYPELPTVRTNFKDPMPALRQAHITTLDPTGARTHLFAKDQADAAKPGDVLMVSTKTGEPFSGVLVEIRRRGVDTAILLRGQMMKTSVESWFKVYSPTVTAINIIWRRPKRARRARLTYMRKPEHDKGSVDHLVAAWKKERSTLRTKSGSGSSVRQHKAKGK
ncbi:Ribosomal protein L19 [Cordyceps fumosorosea ARSEF 2679]|uniref:Ribosomal protein L19 n=1 Tax=Cordyceps fumosorosea (strain ARSEF 2679) TaxID=1081104 RepID=A0A167ZDL7_CORFA|nr:Ribosomal protein L19 [Cordyceps fumosorosea ARSEF 2679]OAA67379.1 Ribosomal protein L19 [Cordyceps fumosorosea ARSEF 2679]